MPSFMPYCKAEAIKIEETQGLTTLQAVNIARSRYIIRSTGQHMRLSAASAAKW